MDCCLLGEASDFGSACCEPSIRLTWQEAAMWLFLLEDVDRLDQGFNQGCTGVAQDLPLVKVFFAHLADMLPLVGL